MALVGERWRIWRRWVLAVWLALIGGGLWGAVVRAEEEIPRLLVAPAAVVPGGAVQVQVENHPAGTFCVGLNGPGQHYTLGIAPRLHRRLGTITVGGDGLGSATVMVPAETPNGYYTVLVGPCPVQPDLAPLTWRTSALLAVGAVPVLTSEPRPGLLWFFAEGSTQPPFHTWLHLFNPDGERSAIVTITAFSDRPLQPVTTVVGPRQRQSLFLNAILPPVAFGLRVESTLPIVAERAMFFRQDGTVSPGVAAPSTSWLLAEGSTQFPFHTWILVLNPNPVGTTVVLRFESPDGRNQTVTLPVGPGQRASLFVNQVLPDAVFLTRIASDQPVVVERAMYLLTSGGGHSTPGAIAPQEVWFFAEGSAQPPFDTWYLVANPHPHPVRVRLQFLGEGGSGPRTEVVVPGNGRASLFLNQPGPGLAAGAVVTAEGGPVVVERAMYFRGGAHATLGASAPGRVWLLAEGSTQPPFDTWLLLANPQATDSRAVVTLAFPDGSSQVQTLTVPAQGRRSLFLNQLAPDRTFGLQVASDLPLVVERSMYLAGGRGGTNTIGLRQ